MSLTGIGPAIAAVMIREVHCRQFDSRRQVAGFLGLATTPSQQQRCGAIPGNLPGEAKCAGP
jgi:transposase